MPRALPYLFPSPSSVRPPARRRPPAQRFRRTHLPPVQPAPPAEPAATGPDAALLARLRAGDDDAFRELVREQMPILLRVTRRLLRSEDEARDAVQDAFVAAFRGLPSFRGDSRLGTWLYRIAVNAALAKLRARAGADEVSLDEWLPRFAEDGHQVEPSAPWPTDAGAEQAEVRAHVRRAIDRLPDTYRTVILLRDIEELSTDEAAEVLGISPGAVKVRLHRARQALRTLLDPWMRGERE
ncbi:MAG TPA: sigma-70 family RNA polymerase sigma factor [Longimicrobium sp.]